MLVIKLGALGDVVMATALLRTLQAHHAGEALWLLTAPAYARLFDAWEGLSVRAMERKGLGPALKTVRWMRGRGFRRLYDFQSSERTAVLTALSGVPERVGNRPGFPYNLGPAAPYDERRHIFEHMQEVLAGAGVAPAAPRPHLPVGAAGRERVAAWMARHGLERGAFVVAHAGTSARWPSKRWPHFAALARALERHGLRVVWVGAAGDADLNAALAREAGIDATGAFAIPELAELGRHARFAVTNDSGPMHVLAAAGIPVYAFFGPTDRRRHHALGQAGRALVLEGVPCAPCYLHRCPAERGHRCLAGLAVEAVLGRLWDDGLLG